MKEFTVCYTCDNDIITEKIVTTDDVKKAAVEKDVYEKMNCNSFFMIKTDQGPQTIDTHSVRYIRIIEEKV